MAERVKVGDIALAVCLQQAVFFEQHVHQQHIADVRLPMVAQHHNVGLFQRSLAPQALQKGAQLFVMPAQLHLGVLVEHAVGVAHRVQIAHFHQHDVRLLKIFQNIQRKRHGVKVQAAVWPFQKASVLIEIALHQIFGGRAGKVLFRLIAVVVVRHNHRHVHVVICPAGDRPAQRAHRHAVRMGHVQQGGRLYVLFHAVPGRIALPAAPQHLVVQNAVAAGIDAGEDGCMAGVGKRREHRVYLFHQRPLPQQFAEMGQRFHVGDIGRTQRIDAEHQKLRHVGPPSPSACGLLKCKFGTVPAKAACHGWAAAAPGYRNGTESARAGLPRPQNTSPGRGSRGRSNFRRRRLHIQTRRAAQCGAGWHMPGQTRQWACRLHAGRRRPGWEG